MSNYLEAELQRIVAVTEKNEKISSEYSQRFFRIFLTAAEAKELLETIESHRVCQLVSARAAS